MLVAMRFVLASGLTFTAALKLMDSGGRSGVALPWLGQVGGPVFLAVVAAAELGLASLLLSRAWRATSLVAFVMLAAYGVLLSVIVLQGQPANTCGCFGSWHAPVGVHYAMLFGLLLVSRCLICATPGPTSAPSTSKY